MGGTLPVLISYLVRQEGRFGKNFSLLYGLNTFGAVAGVLLAGFVTIGLFGEQQTINIGVILNLAVGVSVYLLYKKKQMPTPANDDKPLEIPMENTQISPYADNIRTLVLITFTISGFTALAYEVIWSRQLVLYLMTSIYAFSAMLAVFLTGIAIGSFVMNKYVDGLKKPLIVFGTIEMLVGAVSLLSLYVFQPLAGNLFTKMVSPLIIVFPIALLFGTIFPIASLCYVKTIGKSGTSTGTLYCFNTLGNVAGSLATGFLFFSLLGSSKTIMLLAFINLVVGLILVAAEECGFRMFKLRYAVIMLVAIAVFWSSRNKNPFQDVIVADAFRYVGSKGKIVYHKEHAEATVTAALSADKRKKLVLLNGVGQTTNCTETKLIAHLPILLSEQPKDMLVICFGIGTTLRSAAIYNDIHTTVVELIPAEFDCFKYFYDNAEAIMKQDNVRLVADDGRNFLLGSKEHYDIISIDPSPPIYSAGTVNLYSLEFFNLCKEHMKEDGIMCLWFPLNFQIMKEDRDYLIKTFRTVFPEVSLWQGPRKWGIYLLGSRKPLQIDLEKVNKTFSNHMFIADMTEIDNSCDTPEKLLAMYIPMNSDEIKYVVQDASLITDDYPFTEFPLWRWLKYKYFLSKPKS
jgi:spermidine synthase